MRKSLIADPADRVESTTPSQGWARLPFDECVINVAPRRKTIARHAYRKAGLFPVVDQGQELIGGYTDDRTAVYNDGLPMILFGDHTRAFKYLDFPFAAGADGTKLFRTNEEQLEPRFLFYALKSLDIPARGYNRHLALLRELSIAFPRDKAEQRAIVRVLATIQAGVDVQDRLITALRSLKAATMAALLREGLRRETLAETAVGSIPRSWAVARVADHFVVGNGSTPSRKSSAYWAGGRLPWLTSTRVHDRIIDDATEYVTDLAAHECHLPLVPRGSLVVAITGQGKTLGNAAKVTFDTFINQHLAYLAPRDASVNADFMLAYLETRYVDFRRIASSGGSTKGALTCRFLAEYLFPLPPRWEQDQIAEVWVALTRRLRVAERRRRAGATLFKLLLERLMSGELRVASVAEE